MKRDSIFWGSLLIILGVLFFLNQAGVISGGVFTWFWPIFLIAFGAWVILGIYWKPFAEDGEAFTISRGSAREAVVRFGYGASTIEILGGATGDTLMTGERGVAMSFSSKTIGDKIEVKVEGGPSFMPFLGPSGGVWRFRLNPDLPLQLKVEAGASQITLDLSELNVTHTQMNFGASSAKITMPSRGASILDIEAGAASMDIRIPEGVAARIRMKEGVSSFNIDRNRFPDFADGINQSNGYDQAANRAEINIQAGLGSVNIS